MEGQRKICEDVFFEIFVVIGHRVEEGLLIAENVVIDEMVVHLLFVYLADF